MSVIVNWSCSLLFILGTCYLSIHLCLEAATPPLCSIPSTTCSCLYVLQIAPPESTIKNFLQDYSTYHVPNINNNEKDRFTITLNLNHVRIYRKYVSNNAHVYRYIINSHAH